MVITWDSSCYTTLPSFDTVLKFSEAIANLLPIAGMLYILYCCQCGPFIATKNVELGHLKKHLLAFFQ